MRRISLLLAVTLLALVALGGSAQAAGRLSAAQVANQLKSNHAFVQPGSSPKPDIAALRAERAVQVERERRLAARERAQRIRGHVRRLVPRERRARPSHRHRRA
jgi:hypothetical protein